MGHFFLKGVGNFTYKCTLVRFPFRIIQSSLGSPEYKDLPDFVTKHEIGQVLGVLSLDYGSRQLTERVLTCRFSTVFVFVLGSEDYGHRKGD